MEINELFEVRTAFARVRNDIDSLQKSLFALEQICIDKYLGQHSQILTLLEEINYLRRVCDGKI